MQPARAIIGRFVLVGVSALGCACGRFGFSEADSIRRSGGAQDVSDFSDAASARPHDGGVPGQKLADVVGGSLADAASDAQARVASADGGSVDASVPGSDGGTSGSPGPVDPGCNDNYPRRIWPVAADVASCTTIDGVELATTGPGSPSYTLYNGCAAWLDFQTAPGSPIEIRTFGDGCACPGCLLWHIHYDLEEDLGSGLVSLREVQEPDAEQCPNGVEASNDTTYTPTTTRVRLQTLAGTTGAGFYFIVCGAP